MGFRRGPLFGAAGCSLAVALGAVLVLAPGPGAATGTDGDRCHRFAAASQARERVVAGHGEVTVVIGDSYSVGYALARPQQSWTASLPGRVHVFGFSGSGFSRGASPCGAVAYDQRAGRALAERPALTVIEGGLNDFDQPDASIRAGLRRLLTEVGDRKVLVVGPAPAPARAAGAARVDEVLRRETARSRTPYLSMLGQHFDYLPGQLHLTPSGHRAFGAVVARALVG